MIVDLKELLRVQRYLQEIRKTPLEDIKWTLEGVELVADPQDIEAWKYVGLTPDYFAVDQFMDKVYNFDV